MSTTYEMSISSPQTARPAVFVDASGRRARRVERLGALVVLACTGYGLVMLVAAATGVPIRGAIVPYPALGATAHLSRPAQPRIPAPAVNHNAVVAAETRTPGPLAPGGAVSANPRRVATSSVAASAAQRTQGATGRTTSPTGAIRPTSGPTGTSSPSARGSATSAPGAIYRPTARPTMANTHSSASIRQPSVLSKP